MSNWNKPKSLTDADRKILHKNINLKGIILNHLKNNMGLQIQVARYSTRSYPDTEFAILTYRLDDDLREKFPKKSMLAVGTKVIVDATQAFSYCNPGSLRLDTNENEDHSKQTEKNNNDSKSTESQPSKAGDAVECNPKEFRRNFRDKKKPPASDKVHEKVLQNINADIADIEGNTIVLNFKPNRYDRSSFLRVEETETIDVVYPFDDNGQRLQETMTVLDLKTLVAINDHVRITVRQKQGKFILERINLLNVKKPPPPPPEVNEVHEEPLDENEASSAVDLINLDAKENDEQECLRKETSELLLDLKNEDDELIEKALIEDPQIAADNYMRMPLQTLPEDQRQEAEEQEKMMNDLVELQLEVIPDVMQNGGHYPNEMEQVTAFQEEETVATTDEIAPGDNDDQALIAINNELMTQEEQQPLQALNEEPPVVEEVIIEPEEPPVVGEVIIEPEEVIIEPEEPKMTADPEPEVQATISCKVCEEFPIKFNQTMLEAHDQKVIDFVLKKIGNSQQIRTILSKKYFEAK